MYTTTRPVIDDFLQQKRIAFVGISRNPQDFNRKLWAEMKRLGYDVVPVHPEAHEVDGVRAVPHVTDVHPAVDAALLMIPAEATESVVRDCAAAGIRRVWMYRAVGHGAVSEPALAFCREHGISVVAGECPFMFLKGSGGPHRVHRWFRKLTGTYPA